MNVGDTFIFSSGSGGGGAAAGTFVDAETPSGAVNGSNTTFTLAHTPNGKFLMGTLGGVVLNPNIDFSIVGMTITFTTPPNNVAPLFWYTY